MFHYIHTLITFKTLTLESTFEYIRQKIYIFIFILKFHPGMKCLHVFFVFFSSRNEISSRQKRVNSKRHFTIDRDDFIPEWNFTCRHPLRWKKEKKTCKHFISGWNFKMSMFFFFIFDVCIQICFPKLTYLNIMRVWT